MSEGYYWTMLAIGVSLLGLSVIGAWTLGGIVILVIAGVFFIVGQVVE